MAKHEHVDVRMSKREVLAKDMSAFQMTEGVFKILASVSRPSRVPFGVKMRLQTSWQQQGHGATVVVIMTWRLRAVAIDATAA